MTVYLDYTPEEQELLRTSLRSAAVAVSAASPGRKEETVSEGFAAAEYILDSREAYASNSLVTSIILAVEARVKAEEPFLDYVVVAAAPGALEQALEALRSVVVLLDAKATPEEASGFRVWLASIASVVASAGKEDQGFLGRGGVRVNDAERAVLDEVASILGVHT